MNSASNESETQRVIVTAGGSGIGLAIAQHFLHSGALVYICDVDADCLRTTLAENTGMQGAVADVSKSDQVEQFFSEAIAGMGSVDVLVNNAGIGGPSAPIEEIEYQDWDQCMAVNLSGMFYCIKQVIPAMRRQGGGCIINISTASAKTGLPKRLPYVASKVGVLGLTHNVARELGADNIRCNAILPGLMDNPRGRKLVQKFAHQSGITAEEAEQGFLQYISMRTWIQPSEVAAVAGFLASDAGRHVTAQEISVDGNCEWEQ